MASPAAGKNAPTALLARRSLILLVVSVLTIVAGYAVLTSGSAELASVLLVLGYCVLFPLALLA